MFQLKISGAIVVVVLAVMGFAYYALSSGVSVSILGREVTGVSAARSNVAQVRYSAEEALKQSVLPLASDPTVITELGSLRRMAVESGSVKPLTDQNNRLTLFNHLLQWSLKVEQELLATYNNLNRGDPTAAAEAAFSRPLVDWWGGKPDVLLAFVTMPLKQSRSAAVLVAHAKKGSELLAGRNYAEELPVLKRAEELRKPQIDVIAWDSFEYLVAASPVLNAENEVIGLVVIGYQLDSALADRFGATAGAGKLVLIFSGERLYAQENAAGIKDKLADSKFYAVEVDADRAQLAGDEELSFEDLEGTKSYATEIDGQRFLLQRQDWLAGPKDPRVGFFVVADYGVAMQPVEDLKYQIPLVGVVLLIIALVLTLVFIRSFIKPLEDIDSGIQEILNGNRDFVFRARTDNPVHAELANSLNHLTAYLQGKTPEGEEGWDQLMVDLEPERPSVYGLQAIQVVSESEREKFKSLYAEYMAKREELGQHVDMDYERFCRRIKRNETSLKEKHNCKSVEFSVAIADDKVVLKPKPIFD